MPVLSALLVTTTLVVVAVCIRVCARVAKRHQKGVCPADELRALRKVIASNEPLPPESESGEASASLEARVVREVLSAPSRPVAVLALNELTAEVGFALEDARSLPPALARIALLSGTALGLVAMASGLRDGKGGEAATWGGICVALGLSGWAACSAYARVAREAAGRRREAARELIRALEPRLPQPTEGRG